MPLKVKIKNVFARDSEKNVTVVAPDGKIYSLAPQDKCTISLADIGENMTISAEKAKQKIACGIQFQSTSDSLSALTLAHDKEKTDCEWKITNTGGMNKADENVNISAGDDDQGGDAR